MHTLFTLTHILHVIMYVHIRSYKQIIYTSIDCCPGEYSNFMFSTYVPHIYMVSAAGLILIWEYRHKVPAFVYLFKLISL